MHDHLDEKKKSHLFYIIETALIILLALVPLLVSFPYRVNIFLSWEGAYRLSEGQIPYRDFGMPLGYMYWVVPAVFFKVFGPQLITLVKAQVFINVISGLAFRSILKSLQVQPGIRLLSVFLYCISFSFFNFWPWYNHTVIVYEMIALAFLMRYFFAGRRRWILLSLSALFTFFSFFTKQDGGGLAFLLCLVLLAYNGVYEKQWKPLLIYLVSVAIAAFAILLPLARYNFGYWFNYGQPPHTARISAFEIADEFFAASQWIKFYLLLIVLLVLGLYKKNKKEFLTNRTSGLFLLLTLGILVEAAVLQVTSYTPPDNNIFFHSFAFAFILFFLSKFLRLDFYNYKTLLVGCAALMLWWSGVFWKYVQRIAQRILPATEAHAAGGENRVDRHTYILHPPTGEIPESEWVLTGLKAFEKVYMPRPTAEGISRLLNSAPVKSKKDLHVLNMTELTPLAVEMPYRLETGPQTPLWYHLGVSMFNREAEMYEQRIRNKEYDLVLFEYIPSLNNFYPFRIRNTLLKEYRRIDSFPAPRRGDTQGTVEVFTRP